MQYIFWDEHFDVGYEPFNEQHKEIFRLQNRVVNLLCGDAGPEDLSTVLNHLIRYCQSHFKEEEDLMSRYGYSDLETHCQEHERLVTHIFTLNEQLCRENFNRDRLLTFLNTWITGHIMKIDRKYRKFFLEKVPEHTTEDQISDQAASENSSQSTPQEASR